MQEKWCIINELGDKVLFIEDAYLIMYLERPFSSGYNVYKKTEEEFKYKKLNNLLSWFITLEAAEEFIEEDKKQIRSTNIQAVEESEG